MKFAFSNIAWSPHDSPDVFSLLKRNGVTGIEMAPTKVWPNWTGATPAAAQAYRSRLEDQGFVVPALQAVLFGRPEARLFDDEGERKLIEHLTQVASLAAALRARTVVLGAPRQRDRGNLSFEEALASAAPTFRRLGEIYSDHGICLCIEPNPRRYGCNFVVNSVEATALIRAVASPGFGLHLDAASMHLEGERLDGIWRDVAPFVRHYHISEPDLGDFRTPSVPQRANLDFLSKSGYEGWCSVEMREPSTSLFEAGPWSILSSWASSQGTK
jgi:D-psicose/D-tagatose/L-ribulose 3-epimerase